MTILKLPRAARKAGSMPKRKWQAAKLDALVAEMESRVRQGCASEIQQEVEISEVVGCWLYKLLECAVEPKSKGRQA